MKKIEYLALSFMLVSLFAISFISAVPAAPSPKCRITGKIIEITFKPAYFQEDNGLPCNAGGVNVPAMYLLTVKITQVSTVQQEGDQNCTAVYPINSERTLTISESSINSGDLFEKDKIIEGDIHFAGDECLGGIYLSNYVLSAANDNACAKDSDCEVYFSSCSCANVCIVKNQDNIIDCARACTTEESNLTIQSCKCEDNTCVGKKNSEECRKQVESCGGAPPSPGSTAVACCSGLICKLSENDSEVGVCVKENLKNKIKIMPETASARAIERLGELGFNITLKEVGKGNNTRARYHLEAKKQYKIFGFMKRNATVSTEVDAETGEVVFVKKPWWSFLASE